MRSLTFILTLLACLDLASASAESPTKPRRFQDVADLAISVEPAQVKPGQVVEVKITITPKLGYHTYPQVVPEGQIGQNVLNVPKGDLIPVEPFADPAGWEEVKRSDSFLSDHHYTSTVTWRAKAVVSPRAEAGKKSYELKGTNLQACKTSCFNLKNPKVDFEVLSGPVQTVPAEFAEIVDKALGETKPEPTIKAPSEGVKEPSKKSEPVEPKLNLKGIIKTKPLPTEEYKVRLDSLRSIIDVTPSTVKGGFFGLILAGIFWGYVSLVTPCVFPMIPITVSLFIKHGHQSTGGAVKLAAVYCLTIIVVLGSAAVFLLSVFRDLSVNPFMNIFLGGLFIVFALSLFGMYDLVLPGFLLQFTERRRGAGGMIGTVFAALAFSIVSFTCVAPFLGGFAGLVASGQYGKGELIAAGVAFAAAFASPFFFLALFPSMIKKLPKSGGWLDSVKVVMGFLEMAAALKFFRTAEIRLLDHTVYFTYDLVLGGWVAISIALGLYLLNIYRLPHDEEKSNVGVTRMLLGVMFLGLSIYLTPALFKQRPAGIVYAWIDAFLLPEPSDMSDELPWSTDLKGSVDEIIQAKRSGKPLEKPLILIDFTGENCSNCRINERDVFTRSDIRELMTRYTLVQMYCDGVPTIYFTEPHPDRAEEGTLNAKFQADIFQNEQRPFYALLKPEASGRASVLGVYEEGKINDVAAFKEFLKKPLESQ